MKNKPVRIALLIAVSLLALWAAVSCGRGALVTDEARSLQQNQPAALLVEPPLIYLPHMLRGNPIDPLQLENVWTANAAGDPAILFLANEMVVYQAAGLSVAPDPLHTSLTWSLQGPCDTSTLYTETRTLEPGAWTAVFSQTAPVCSGLYTYTFQTQALSSTYTASAFFAITNAVDVVVWKRPAFDKCDLPSLAQMAVWWPHSPYWAVNLYIGGIHRACANLNLTPEWVSSALAQGWGLIPTWVGPQAPCSRYTHRISYDLDQAYLQGRAEADAAVLAAASLGLTASGTGGSIIYYDMEGYSWRDQPGCRAGVKSFLSGWTERLHELGSQSGVYGGSCSSYVSDWAGIPHPPDYVWIAAWYADGYDPQAGVFSVPCVSSALWANNQRIRQYAGDVSETWGGLRMNIDCNITAGAVLAEVVSPPDAHIPPELVQGESSQVSSFDLLPQGQAWALMDGELFLLEQAAWEARSQADGTAQQAFFLDASQGWLLTGTGPFAVSRTADGGQTWLSAPLGGEELIGARPLGLSFVDAQNGWAVLRLPSSANFSLGALYRTQDGGLTWQALPEPPGATLRFVTAQQGWALGGPLGDRLYRTQDGGFSWVEQSLPAADLPGPAFYALPVFDDLQNGALAVTVVESGFARLHLYASQDSGSTWVLQGRVAVQAAAGLDGPLPAVQLDARHAWVADPSGGLYITADGGRTWQFSAALPPGVTEMNFSSQQEGWALASAGDCAPGQPCAQQSALWQTQDGGLTWHPIEDIR